MQHHEDDAQAKPADSVEATPAVAPAAQAVATAAVVEAPVAETQTQTQTAPTQPVVPQPVVQQEQPVVQAPVAETQTQTQTAPTQPVVQQPPQAQQAAPVAVQQQPEAQQADAQPVVDDKPAVQGAAVPVAKPKQEQQPDTGQQQGNEPQHEQGSLPQQASDQARTVAQAYGRNAQQHANHEVPTTAQSGTPAAPAATSVASGQPAAARVELAPPTPVPLARAAETVEHVLRLASNRGVTHARIALKPESLGSIDVHLRHTSDGVVAKLVAHAPEAVQQLQQAAADLRQQLEGQGVNVLSLDIGQSQDERSAASAGFGDERGEARGEANASGEATAADAEQTVNSTLQLPDGVLVDVLA